MTIAVLLLRTVAFFLTDILLLFLSNKKILAGDTLT
jgi:hypothetical protein